ncbi:trypsin-like peptidase domain-containing protein [Streptomyces sp. NPDC057582]|uniref:trypsin-like peptidase domain-containing protein n=1 Tax=Streptomyces sp. NPDC057582 TaxID=3346174 RepID=UPI003691CC0A
MGSGDRSTLVRICDPAGRLRGTGFVADDRGTVVTSHEAVDGLARLVLYGTGDRSRSVGAEAITALPELDLALVRTGGIDVLGVEPLPIVQRDRIEPGTYVRIAAHGWREARVPGAVPVTYGAAGRSHRVGAALEPALGTDGSDALRLRGAAIGGPVLDPQTGAVRAVLGTALRAAHAAAGFAHRLADLIEAMDRLSTRTDGGAGGRAPADGAERTGPLRDASWWAAHLLAETLLRVPDARPYLGVARLLTGRIVRRAGALGTYGEFSPWFWRRLRLPEADRIDLLRRLVPADGTSRGDGGRDGDDDARDGGGNGEERFLDVVARRLVARPRTVQPLLCLWFTDERPLSAEDGAATRPTVAAAAQALLYARRDLAVDDLTDALVATVHPRADELLATLAEDEPAVLCRAVDRWARDDVRRARRVAAASYGLVTAPHATRDTDREPLRRSALSLLARPGDVDLHGAALVLLVRDPHTRNRCLPQALRVFVRGDPYLSAAALAVALPTHPEPVIGAFRDRLTRPGDGAGEALRSLAGIDAPALALHAAGLVRAYADNHPDGGAHVAAYLDRRLEHGPAARALLLPLVTGLLRDRPASAPGRGALARVLAVPGAPASGAVRAELLEVLLEFEQGAHRDPVVLDALLCAAAHGSDRRAPVRTRALVHRTGMLLVRTPEGAACFDRRLVELARDVPGFAELVTGWLADAPQEWAAVIGPGARRTVEAVSTAMPMPMQAAGRGHGSLRPA